MILSVDTSLISIKKLFSPAANHSQKSQYRDLFPKIELTHFPANLNRNIIKCHLKFRSVKSRCLVKTVAKGLSKLSKG